MTKNTFSCKYGESFHFCYRAVHLSFAIDATKNNSNSLQTTCLVGRHGIYAFLLLGSPLYIRTAASDNLVPSPRESHLECLSSQTQAQGLAFPWKQVCETDKCLILTWFVCHWPEKISLAKQIFNNYSTSARWIFTNHSMSARWISVGR